MTLNQLIERLIDLRDNFPPTNGPTGNYKVTVYAKDGLGTDITQTKDAKQLLLVDEPQLLVIRP